MQAGTKVKINDENPTVPWNGWVGTVIKHDGCDCENCTDKIMVVFDKCVSYGLELFPAGCPFVFKPSELEYASVV